MLVVEQLLEIIFTLLTENVPDEAPTPLEAELFAPALAPPLMLPFVLPAPAFPETEPPGLAAPLVEVLALASDPLSRTWWPT